MNTYINSVSPAFNDDYEDSTCVYSDVMFQGVEYTVQISRPRHPMIIGAELDAGVDIHTDEGHDDNARLYEAAAGADLDWDALVADIATRSGAEALLDSIRAD